MPRSATVTLILTLRFDHVIKFLNIVFNLAQFLLKCIGVARLVLLAAVGPGGLDAEFDEVMYCLAVLAGGHPVEVELQFRDLTDYFLHFII